MVTPGGSYLHGRSDTANLPTGIVTYSLHRGLMLGQSVDERHLRLLDQANLRLYGKPLRSGEISTSSDRVCACLRRWRCFTDYVNAELGKPAHQMDWKAGGPMPKR